MFDIDFFKLSNEFYGPVGGDDCLRWRCRGERHSCQAGWGFDRPLRRRRICRSAAQHAEGANVVAREICYGIASLKLPHARSSIDPYVTLSGGSATAIPSAQESPDTLILGADSALYQAKTEGKNRICHASSN